MKKIMSLMIGLMLVMGTAAFAADEKPAKAPAGEKKKKKPAKKADEKKEAAK